MGDLLGKACKEEVTKMVMTWRVALIWYAARLLLAFLISVFVSMWALGEDYYWDAVWTTLLGIIVWYMIYEMAFME